MAFEGIPEADAALRAFALSPPASLPEHTAATLAEVQAQLSPVDRIVKSGEALYAVLTDLTIAGKELCAGLISLASPQGWHGLAEDNRGLRMVKACRRELGEESPTGSWPDPESDPEPKAEYLAAAAPETPPVP